MSVLAPYRSTMAAGSDGFGSLLRAEWTKLRSVRGWLIGLVVGALLIVGLAALTGAGSSCGMQSSGSSGKTISQACPAPAAGPNGEWVTDSYFFVRQPLTGNGSLTVRVTSLTGLQSATGGAARASGSPGLTAGVQPWSKAGIIVTASTRQGAAYAAMMVTGGHGVRLQWNYVNDVGGLPGTVSAASPRWLRLVRSGDVLTGYDSADGTHWTEVGRVTLAGLPGTVQAGLFATSPGHTVTSTTLGGGSSTGGPTLATGRFDQVRLGGTWTAGASRAAGPWIGQDIQSNADGIVMPAAAQGFTQSGGVFTVTGSGDIAPSDKNQGGMQEAFAGTFAGLIAFAVIGVMFVTAEYRRGLIRTTFAANPRRGRVLAAKAIVLALATFAAGLVALVISVWLGERLLRANGNPVAPVPALTAIRAIAGSAALLAVATVLALALGTALRRSAGAVTAAIGVVILPYLLAVIPGVLPVGAEAWLLRVTPAAGFAIQQLTPAYPQVTDNTVGGLDNFPLAPWAGFGVLCAWGAVALFAAAWLLRRRDA